MELVGTWRLESFLGVSVDGTVVEGPLGPSPSGLLMYGPDGFMSVSMMGTGFMGYAGKWELADALVVHVVSVSSHAYLIGTRQERSFSISDDLLTLSGSSGGSRRGVLTWRRA